MVSSNTVRNPVLWILRVKEKKIVKEKLTIFLGKGTDVYLIKMTKINLLAQFVMKK